MIKGQSIYGSVIPTRVADRVAKQYFAAIALLNATTDPERHTKLAAHVADLAAEYRKAHQSGEWEVEREGGEPKLNRKRGNGAGCRPLTADERGKIVGMYTRGVRTDVIASTYGGSVKLMYEVLREEGVELTRRGSRDAGSNSKGG